MKNTPIRIALGFATLLLASTVLAQEPVDCFYEANHGHALCQPKMSMKSAPESISANGYSAPQLVSDETVDCFYEANRWNAACAATPERVTMHQTK